MSSYILSGLSGEDIDEQSFEAFLEDFEQSTLHPRAAPVLEEVEIQYLPVWSRDKKGVFLSIKVVPKRRTQSIAIIVIIIGLICTELLTLLLPSLVTMVIHWNSVASSLVAVVLGIALMIAVLSPVIILTWFGLLCTFEELYLETMLNVHAIEVSSLSPKYNWILFPADKYVLSGSALIVFFLQALADFQAWDFFRPAFPILVFMLLMFIFIVIRILAYKAIGDTTHLIYYWKLRTTWMAVSASTVFLLPLLFFVFSFLFENVSLALANIQTRMFSYHNLFTLDLSFLFPYGIGPNAAAYLRLYLTQPQLWDSFHQRFSYMLFYGEWLLVLCLLLFVGLAIRYGELFSTGLYDVRDLQPASTDQTASQTASRAIDIAILLEWLILSVVKFIGASLVVVGVFTVFDLPFMDWGPPASLLLPFVWFEASLQVVLSTLVGTILARVVLMLIFLPTVLWFLLWFSSLCYQCYKSLRYLYSRNKNVSELQNTITELCQKLHLPTPIIIIEKEAPIFPVTTVLFPKHCVIHISSALLEVLDNKDVHLMLAHELGHVAKHSTRMWWFQILSCISLNGVGYLTLLLNYWKMEIEADEYALFVTKDRQGLISLLERTKDIEQSVIGKIDEQQKNEGKKQVSALYRRILRNKLIGQLTKAYNLYFATNLWGEYHPNQQERIDHLRIFGKTMPQTPSQDDEGTNDTEPAKKEEINQQPIADENAAAN